MQIIDVVDNNTIWSTDQKSTFYRSDSFAGEWKEISFESMGINGYAINLDFVSKDAGWIVVHSENNFSLYRTVDGKQWFVVDAKLIEYEN